MATFLKTPSDEGVICTAVNTLPPNPQVGWYVLISAILGSSMAFLDSSVVGVALPPLGRTCGGPRGSKAATGCRPAHHSHWHGPLCCASHWWCVLGDVFPAVLVIGLDMALNTVPMNIMVMGAIEQCHAGIASAINNAVARIGGLLAIVVLGIVLISAFNSSLDSHLEHLLLSPGLRHRVVAQRVKLAGIQLPAGINRQLHAALKLAIGESFVSGFRLAALVCAGLALAGALCGWVMIEDMPSKRAGGAVTGERAGDENELSLSTAPGGLPGSHA